MLVSSEDAADFILEVLPTTEMRTQFIPIFGQVFNDILQGHRDAGTKPDPKDIRDAFYLRRRFADMGLDVTPLQSVFNAAEVFLA